MKTHKPRQRSTDDFYSYENNIEIKKQDSSVKGCVCCVEQYLKMEDTFAPPKSIQKLDSYLSKMLENTTLFQKKEISLFQNLVDLSRTNLFNGPKRVRVKLNNSSFQTIAGALHYMKGNIKMESKTKLKNLAGKKSSPKYIGTGEVYLEPVPANTHFMFVPVNGIVKCDKGVFYACSGSVKKSTKIIKGIGAKLVGGEGLFEHVFEGKGWVLLRVPVPPSEIHKVNIDENNPLCVDGPFAILRRGDINFGVKSMAGKGLGSLLNTSGEGWVNTYQGKGEVWLCPTMK